MSITVHPVVNEFGQSVLIIEGKEDSVSSREFEILKDFFRKLNARKDNKKVVVGLDSYERQELSLPRHQLPEKYRQDDEVKLNLVNVAPAFKHTVYGLIIQAIVTSEELVVESD